MAGGFTRQIDGFVTQTKTTRDQRVRYICLNLFRDVIMGTPVLTGRARGNWQATVDTPAMDTLSRTDRTGNIVAASGAGAVRDAPGKVFYITNNLPYILRLEYEGHSQQAPSGWVRTAVENAKLLNSRLSAMR